MISDKDKSFEIDIKTKKGKLGMHKFKSFRSKKKLKSRNLGKSNESEEAKSSKSLSKSTHSYVPSLISGSVDMFIHGAHEKSDDGGKWEETSGSSDQSFDEIPEVNSEDEEI